MSNGLGGGYRVAEIGALDGGAARDDAPAVCDECGYDLRGTATGGACPECGRVPDGAAVRVPAGAVWTVSVTLGLGLLLLLTLDGVSSVLVQPFDEALGGTLPSLNLPGPKLWAVPLLQRPIGNSPELPGVIGTRTAMASLLAFWLVTARPPRGERPARDPVTPGETLRLATRWGALAAFGANFGVLVSQHGLWPSQLPPYRVLLVATAELPATVLLYLYLARLAAALPGRARRRAFERLAWVVPAVIAVAAGMLVLTWLWLPDDRLLIVPQVNLPVSVVYGTVALCAGVAATAATAWLAGGFALRAFPAAWRALLGTRRWVRSLRGADLASGAVRRRAGSYAVAGGLVLLVVVMVFGIEKVGWYTGRAGLAGNLPFYNYPGPKLWAATAAPELAARYYWEPIVSRTTLTVMNLLAFWLVTAGPLGGVGRERRGERLLRVAVRWLPVLLVGAALGTASAVRGESDYGDGPLAGRFRSEFFALVTVACELPATVLLYVHLGVLARRCGRPRLRTGLWVVAVLIVALVGAGLSGFVLSRMAGGRSAFDDPPVLAAGAAYGAASLLVATWAVALILSLAAAVCASRRSSE